MTATLGLITLMAEDWYETVDFYADLLGLRILESDEIAGRAKLALAPDVVLEIQSGGWGCEGAKSAKESPVALCLQTDDLTKKSIELEYRGVQFVREPEEHLLSIMDTEGNRLYLYDTPDPPRIPDGWDIQDLGNEDEDSE